MNTKKHLECHILGCGTDVDGFHRLYATFKPEDMPSVNFVYNDCVLMRKDEFEDMQFHMQINNTPMRMLCVEIIATLRANMLTGRMTTQNDTEFMGKINEWHVKMTQLL